MNVEFKERGRERGVKEQQSKRKETREVARMGAVRRTISS